MTPTMQDFSREKSLIRLYAKTEPYSPLVRIGRTFVSMAKALDRAKTMKALEVEVRDDSKPRSRNLLAVFVEGRRVAN